MRSSRAILALSLVLASSGLAAAADAIVEQGAAAPVASPASLYTWAGPYGGAFVGYNFADFDQDGGASFDGEGFIGGVYAGYSFQSDQFVYGVEADVGASDVDGSGFNAATGLPAGADSGTFGSVRGRVGIAYDPFLLFATGGVAVAQSELSLGGAQDENTHFGYTVGAGIDASVTDNLTSRIEYRYSDYRSEDYDLDSVTISSGFDEHSIRAGLALRF